MLNEKVPSAGRFSDRRSAIQLKTWLEEIRDKLIQAIKGADNELKRITQIEYSFSKVEAFSPVLQGLTAIRGGMDGCLNVLRDQNGELDTRIIFIEDLERISADGEASNELLDGFLIELKTCLESVHNMLTYAIKDAGKGLERIRQMESSFSRIEVLCPIVESLSVIRGGMEECLNVLRGGNGELDNNVTWVKNPERTSATSEASPDMRGQEDRLEIQEAAPSKALVSGYRIETFPDEELTRINKRETNASALSRSFSKRSFLILFSFVFITVLITASLIYLMTNQFNQLAELHKSVSVLENELSKTYSANKELELKNADLNKYMTDAEAHSSELKDKNDELKMALLVANSSLAQSEKDLDAMKASSLRTKSEIKAKSLEIANTRTELEGLRHLSEFLKAESTGSLILDPVWLKSGESAQILGGRLIMRLQQAADQDTSSDLIVQLLPTQLEFAALRKINQYNKILCLRLGIPENFRFKNNRFSILLLSSKINNDETKAYLVAVFKK